ncbi:electron transport complex subunit RsxC [Candidatus Woesearchaeota archaeon]|nr:electron transport complex subunit RsxC [Candidatus Woesearchaeota archaeon]|tara:strand:- start:1167 stop:2474 length:1308 start_codon:yes stop_codon:yes gene_type:complete
MTSFLLNKGIYLPHLELTENSKIEVLSAQRRVIIPLQQHIGKGCQPVVKAGDSVKEGQKIGKSDGFVSASVHSSVSGRVIEVKEWLHPMGKKVLSVVIESNGKDEGFKENKSADKLGRDKLLSIIKEAGIVGLGGATFPTHVKLSPPKEKKIDTVILNGAECEPYLTADHRLMLEYSSEIVKGLKVLMKIVNAKNGFIGVEDNKRDAIKAIKKEVGSDNNIKVVSLKTKYPLGAEKMLIKELVGRVVPLNGLPMDVGVVVNNVGTAKAVYDAVYLGKPLIERVVTVTGNVNEPKNVMVKIGTLVRDLVKECGGYKGSPKKLIMGGPMMGIAQSSDNVPVIKGSSGVLVLGDAEEPEERECIRCGKCVDYCPMNLMPITIARFGRAERIKQAEEYYATACFECGICSYVCPSKVPLVKWIKYAKEKIRESKEGGVK